MNPTTKNLGSVFTIVRVGGADLLEVQGTSSVYLTLHRRLKGRLSVVIDGQYTYSQSLQSSGQVGDLLTSISVVVHRVLVGRLRIVECRNSVHFTNNKIRLIQTPIKQSLSVGVGFKYNHGNSFTLLLVLWVMSSCFHSDYNKIHKYTMWNGDRTQNTEEIFFFKIVFICIRMYYVKSKENIEIFLTSYDIHLKTLNEIVKILMRPNNIHPVRGTTYFNVLGIKQKTTVACKLINFCPDGVRKSVHMRTPCVQVLKEIP